MNINPYQALGNAVVLQAVKDWRDSAEILKRNRRNESAKTMRDECERFFKSPYFNIFTELDGNMLLAQLKMEVAE